MLPIIVAHDDIVPNHRRGGELRTLLAPSTVGATSGFMGVVTLETGESISEHYHPYSEEFLFVVRGQLHLRLDGETCDLSAGQSILIPKNVRHRLENDTDEQLFAVFFLSPLAPRPELGHVDTETQPQAAALPAKTVNR